MVFIIYPLPGRKSPPKKIHTLAGMPVALIRPRTRCGIVWICFCNVTRSCTDGRVGPLQKQSLLQLIPKILIKDEGLERMPHVPPTTLSKPEPNESLRCRLEICPSPSGKKGSVSEDTDTGGHMRAAQPLGHSCFPACTKPQPSAAAAAEGAHVEPRWRHIKLGHCKEEVAGVCKLAV